MRIKYYDIQSMNPTSKQVVLFNGDKLKLMAESSVSKRLKNGGFYYPNIRFFTDVKISLSGAGRQSYKTADNYTVRTKTVSRDNYNDVSISDSQALALKKKAGENYYDYDRKVVLKDKWQVILACERKSLTTDYYPDIRTVSKRSLLGSKYTKKYITYIDIRKHFGVKSK